MKPFISVLLVLILVILLSVPAFAAGGFKQSEYDKLKTRAEKQAYIDEVFRYYDKNGSWGELPAEEITAFNEARWALNGAPKTLTYTSNVPEADAKIIARIKENYDITIELGAGTYEKGAPLTKHLTNIETALSYLGSGFIKKIVKAHTSFSINLIPSTDASATVVGYGVSQDTAMYYHSDDGSGRISLTGNETYSVRVDSLVHEFGHALDYAVRKMKEHPSPFNNETYTGKEGGTNVASKYPDRFVSQYAEKKLLEDYAETFRVAIMSGTDKPIAYGKDTGVYKKTKAIYDDLQAFAGADSRATQRVGGYLGLNP